MSSSCSKQSHGHQSKVLPRPPRTTSSLARDCLTSDLAEKSMASSAETPSAWNRLRIDEGLFRQHQDALYKDFSVACEREEEDASSPAMAGSVAAEQRPHGLFKDLQRTHEELLLIRQKVGHLLRANEDLQFEAMEAKEEVEDIIDMIQDEVARCNIPMTRDPNFSGYRASYALNGLERLGRQYRRLQHKHFGFANHMVDFFKHAGKWHENPQLRQMCTIIKTFFPSLTELDAVLCHGEVRYADGSLYDNQGCGKRTRIENVTDASHRSSDQDEAISKRQKHGADILLKTVE